MVRKATQKAEEKAKEIQVAWSYFQRWKEIWAETREELTELAGLDRCRIVAATQATVEGWYQRITKVSPRIVQNSDSCYLIFEIEKQEWVDAQRENLQVSVTTLESRVVTKTWRFSFSGSRVWSHWRHHIDGRILRPL